MSPYVVTCRYPTVVSPFTCKTKDAKCDLRLMREPPNAGLWFTICHSTTYFQRLLGDGGEPPLTPLLLLPAPRCRWLHPLRFQPRGCARDPRGLSWSLHLKHAELTGRWSHSQVGNDCPPAIHNILWISPEYDVHYPSSTRTCQLETFMLIGRFSAPHTQLTCLKRMNHENKLKHNL